MLDHPVTGELVVAFISRGAARELADIRERPGVTVVFRSGWEWIAVEGDAELAGPNDRLDGLDPSDVPLLLRTVYAAAVGGEPDEWAELDGTLAAEGHTAVLLRPQGVYPAGAAGDHSVTARDARTTRACFLQSP